MTLHCFYYYASFVETDGEELSKIQKVKLIRNEQREGIISTFKKKYIIYNNNEFNYLYVHLFYIFELTVVCMCVRKLIYYKLNLAPTQILFVELSLFFTFMFLLGRYIYIIYNIYIFLKMFDTVSVIHKQLKQNSITSTHLHVRYDEIFTMHRVDEIQSSGRGYRNSARAHVFR